MRLPAVVLLVGPGCLWTSYEQPPDVPMTLHLGVFRADPSDRPPSSSPPTVYINDVETTSRDVTFPSEQAARLASYEIELRYGPHVVARTTAKVSDNSCLASIDDATHATLSFCMYDNGELRRGSDGATHEDASGGHSCVGEQMCSPHCLPGSSTCGETGKCTSRIVSTVPLASHLGCAPIGPKMLGEACELLPGPPIGDFDNCGDGLLCVEGTCRTLCGPYFAATCTAPEACSFLEGHPPEMRVCL